MSHRPNNSSARAATSQPRTRRRGGTAMLALASAVLAACQSVDPTPPAARWRIEPTQRVTNAGETADANYSLGRYFQGQNRIQPAIDAYRRALAIDPRHAEAHNALGTMVGLQGRLDEAISEFQKALEVAPSAPHILSNLGYALTLDGRYSQAIPLLQRATGLDPINLRNRLNLELAMRLSERAAGPILQVPTAPMLATHDAGEPPVASTAPTQEAVEQGGAPALAARDADEQAVAPVLATLDADELGVPPLPVTREADEQPAALVLAIGNADERGVAPLVTAGDADEQSVAPAIEHAATSAPAVEPAAPYDARTTERAESAPATASASVAEWHEFYRLEIANGMGVTGAAARIGERLAREGAPVARLKNQRPFKETTTVIYFASGFEEEAQRLASHFGRLPVRLQPAQLASSDVRVVIGRDVMQILDAASGLASRNRKESSGA